MFSIGVSFPFLALSQGHGGEVNVKLKDNALAFEIVPAAPKKPRKGKKTEAVKAK